MALGAFGPDPYSKQCSLHLPAQSPLLVADAGVCVASPLGELPLGS